MSLDLVCNLLNKKLPVAYIDCTCAGYLTHPFKTSRDRAGWNTLPVTWRGGNDQQLVITSACFWNGESV